MVDFRDQLMKTATPARSGKLLSTLKRIIAEAQLRGLTAQNVASPVKVTTSNRGKKRLEIGVDIPSKEDIRLLLDNATGRWRPFYVVAVFTGMRASELRGLRWSDVDLDKKQVHVRQRVDRWNNVGPPKSRAGQRSIPLTPFVLNALGEHKLASGGNGLVFPSANNTPLMHSNICNQSFYPLQVKAGVVDEQGGARYNFHAIRHFTASHWIDLGFAPKLIQTWMGHSSVTMTFDVYGHLMPLEEDHHARLAAGELSIVG